MKWLAGAALAVAMAAPLGANATTYTLTEAQFASGTLYPPLSPVAGNANAFFPATPGRYDVTVTAPNLISGLVDQTVHETFTTIEPMGPPVVTELDTENLFPMTLNGGGTMLSLDYTLPNNSVTYIYDMGVLSETIAYDYYPQIGIGLQQSAFDPSALITIQIDAVPEPTTYALAIAGLGLLGAILRRRRSWGAPPSPSCC